MKLKNAIAGILMLFTIAAMADAYAADTVLGSSCDLKIAGGADKQEFLDFDRVLRNAIQKNDSATVATLARYPLNINYSDRTSISLNTPATLQARYSEIFPDYVRDAVLSTKPESVFCNYEGVMYGDGVLWVSLTGSPDALVYKITALNLQSSDGKPKSAQGAKVDFVCDTDKHHVVFDEEGGAHYRYRAWMKDHALDRSPDMEIDTGTEDTDGHGLCSYDIWKFSKGDTEFDVMGLGCTGDNPDEPQDASGQLEILIKGQLKQTEWCHR